MPSRLMRSKEPEKGMVALLRMASRQSLRVEMRSDRRSFSLSLNSSIAFFTFSRLSSGRPARTADHPRAMRSSRAVSRSRSAARALCVASISAAAEEVIVSFSRVTSKSTFASSSFSPPSSSASCPPRLEFFFSFCRYWKVVRKTPPPTVSLRIGIRINPKTAISPRLLRVSTSSALDPSGASSIFLLRIFASSSSPSISFGPETPRSLETCEGTNSAASALRGCNAGRASSGTVIRSARRPLCMSPSVLALHVTHLRVRLGKAGLKFKPVDPVCWLCGKASRPADRDPDVLAMLASRCRDVTFRTPVYQLS
mmetsp:Transcript_29770/g.65033  ORF Transcript_29770/g.65033 Transcript_29770/m.65033 type:complete len:312 (+) Transcript_29770:952-1887(+)